MVHRSVFMVDVAGGWSLVLVIHGDGNGGESGGSSGSGGDWYLGSRS